MERVCVDTVAIGDRKRNFRMNQNPKVEAWYKKHGGRPVWRYCLICGQRFIANTSIGGGRTKIYCSDRCSYIRARRNREVTYWIILNRDNFTCQYCGRNPTEDNVKLAFDHIKPKLDGGRDTLDNLVTACKQCNSAKGSRPLRHEAEFRKRIQRKTGLLQTAFSFMTSHKGN